MKHVDLNRKFLPVSNKDDADPDAIRLNYLWSREPQPGWQELLQMSRVIVLAEAGTGKTEEFRETARRLRREGKAAFFCAIEELVSEGIERAFDVGTFSEFNAWLETNESGWFFLDSVDEARLVSHDHFKRALKRISLSLDRATQRAFVYISGRGSDWNAISDLALIEEYLPTPKSAEQNSKSSEAANLEQLDNSENNVEVAATEPIKIFRLSPLSQEQITVFASHHGVIEPQYFIEAVERADAGIFAERPRDLIDLVEYWKQSGKIASLEVMTEFNIQQKLTETNPTHSKMNPLPALRARAGAETIAAALTFSRSNFIALPDPQSPIHPTHSLDALALLSDWQSREVESLLRRALFDEATYGRARIHHRSVREYLTAQWLHKLLLAGKSRRSVEQWLFAERYGLKVVIPSMKPIVAWMALWDDMICQKLCDIAPEILIGYGDPSRLPIPTRKILLRKFAEVCASNRYYDESLDLSAVRRLADAGLASTINQLLEEYRSNEEVRQLLLRTIWQGAIKECAEAALSFSLDASMDRYTRIGGIRAIGVSGNNDQKRQLITLILANAGAEDVDLTSAVCEQFFPALISVNELLETIERIPKPKRFSISPASHALEQIVEQCPENKLLPILTGFVRLLELEPHIDNYCKISKRYAWLLPHGGNVAYRLLNKCIDEPVLRMVELMEAARDYGEESHPGPKKELQAILDCIPQLRYLFFWRAVERFREVRSKNNERLDDWWFVRFEPAPWRVIIEDFVYFLAQAKSLPDRDNQLVAYSVTLALWNDGGRDNSQLKELRDLSDGNPEMATKLNAYLNPPPMSPETLKDQREMKHWEIKREKNKQQQLIQRQTWIKKLQSDPSQLRNITKSTLKEKFPNLYWLASAIREHKEQGPSKWGIGSWEVLIDEFGRDVAEAARDGLMAYWRLYQPTKRKDNSIPNGLIAGFVGLAIEASTIPEWTRQLTVQEAVLAVSYALHEMNGFPDWTVDLLTIHPQAFDIFRQEFRWEFGLSEGERSAPVHYTLAQLRYSGPPELRARYCPYILELLNSKEPWFDQTLEHVLSILLQCDELDTTKFAVLARKRHTESTDERRSLTWLVAWLCVDADNALVALKYWLSRVRGKIKRKEKMTRFCGAMGSHNFERFGSKYRDFERIEILIKFVPMIYSHIRIEDDNVHDGVYTPDDRDNAEGMRGYLLGRVCDMPGRQAFETLLEFSRILPQKRSRERMQVIALRRAAADAEFVSWEPPDIIKFALEGEKQPSTHRELFDLVCSRLDDIKYDLEDGDYSISATLQRIDQETELRNWFVKSLRTEARGKYSVSPEEELADAKRPDIRVHVPAIDAPCVVELKISDNWSYGEHRERLANQLVGQYLRDARSRFGVFLLVRRFKLRWRSNRMLTFEALVECVQNEADRIVLERSDLDGIKVIGIDLMKRKLKM